jgi:hypothetical protein
MISGLQTFLLSDRPQHPDELAIPAIYDQAEMVWIDMTPAIDHTPVNGIIVVCQSLSIEQ